MADIRINALATTAASTASDDFVAVDGSANGTRKLNAYSPTFGGNLTVSGGTGTFSGSSPTLSTDGLDRAFTFTSPGAGGTMSFLAGGVNWLGASAQAYVGVFIGGNTSVNQLTISQSNSLATLGSALGFKVTNTTASTSTTTGALVVTGGVGVGGAINAGGNLTVSGTGNSSVAGTLLVATTTNSSNGKLQLATHTTSAGGIGFGTDVSLYRATVAFYGFPAVNAALFRSSGSNLIFSSTNYNHYIGQKGDSGDFFISATDSITLQTRGNASNGTTALTLDSSQNATFAGDRVINRKDQNAVTRLQVRNDTSGTSGQAQIAATVGDFTTYTALGQLSAGFTSSGLYQANSGYLVGSNALYIFTASSSSLVLGTNNITALTLDSSQNATFAGNVYAGSSGTTRGLFRVFSTTANAEGNFYGRTGGGVTIDTNGNGYPIRLDGVRVELGSPLRLNNAYVAGAPTATGYVTIQDSAGNTYKVLVGT